MTHHFCEQCGERLPAERGAHIELGVCGPCWAKFTSAEKTAIIMYHMLGVSFSRSFI